MRRLDVHDRFLARPDTVLEVLPVPGTPEHFNAAMRDLIVRPAWRFLRFYVVRRGFLEGIAGLFVAHTAAFYVFTKYAKLWESRHATDDAEPDA